MVAKTAQVEFRQQFAEVAWKLGSSRGYSGLTVRAIAEEMGVSAGLLYAHFEDKAALMAEVQRLASPRLAAILGATPRHGDCTSRLMQSCLAYVEFVREHAWIYGESCAGPDVSPGAAAHRTMFVEHVETLLADAGMSRASCASMAQHLWIGVHGLVAMRLRATTDEPFVDAHVRLLLRGVFAAEALQLPAPRPARVTARPKTGAFEAIREASGEE